MEFAGSTQNNKKMIETPNQPIKTKNLSYKTMFRILKVSRSPKFVSELNDKVQPGALKTIGLNLSSKHLNLCLVFKNLIFFWDF
jgi:hypothetical protein